MTNESLETKIQKKGNSGKIFFVVLIILVLGVLALYAGIKIFSKLSVSADILPPVPGEPLSGPTTTVTPPVPPAPGADLTLNVKKGWNLVSGTDLYGYDMAPVSKAGIFLYSFNDPYLVNKQWTVSSTTCSGQANFFCITSSDKKIFLYPFVGYYLYNPGNAVSLTLKQVSVKTPKPAQIFGRGWHLMHWSGAAATKQELLSKYSIKYADKSSLNLWNAIAEKNHTASIKIYVIVNPAGATTSASVKELTGTDSTTTLSKIPQNSYFWVYLRRTKSRAESISGTLGTTSPLPNQSAVREISGPPVPPEPN